MASRILYQTRYQKNFLWIESCLKTGKLTRHLWKKLHKTWGDIAILSITLKADNIEEKVV